LLSLICFYSSAQASDHRVTINGSGISLKVVFKAIKKQTGFAVMYNTSITMLNQDEKVTVSFKDTPLDDVLSFLLKGRNLSWTYNDDVVVIYKKVEEPSKKNEVDSTVTPSLLTGKVTDAAGSPLPGVTVQVKGSNQGATTDGDGKFTLAKIKNGDVLVISSVGFETRTLEVKGRSVLAQLNVQVSSLDETVVIAYGTTTQRLSTSNIGTIKAKDIEKQPINNPLLALQGRIPGLVVTQANGLPGSQITVRIQGQNSIGNGNDPLYIIDGVPYQSQNLGTFLGSSILGSFRSTAGNPLSFINSADIESIDVLKDADATAIYGSRAANGAILITTKKGAIGSTRVDINLQQGWGQVGRFIDLMNSSEYLLMRKEAKKNDNEPISAADYDLNGLWDTSRYTNWQKTLIGGTAQYSQYSGSVSGGNPNMQYLVGGTFHRETTVYPGSFADTKGSIHFNINGSSNSQNFRLQLTGSYLVNKSNLPTNDLTNHIFLAPVAPPLYNSDGTLNWAPDPNMNGNSSWTNPLSEIYIPFESKTTSLVSNGTVSYRITPQLELKSSFGYTSLVSNQFSASLISSTPPESWPNFFRYALFSSNTSKSWIIEPQLSYLKNIKRGKLELLLGATIQQQDNEGQGIVATGQPNDQLLRSIAASTAIYPNGSDISTYKYVAGFGRLNYNWKDKYIINIVARRDGSSRFGDKNKFHSFASFGGAWIFSQETFFANKISFLSFGKIRGSYGNTGSDQIGNYQYLNLYQPYRTGNPYQGGSALISTGLPNPYLQWEQTRKLQIGLDLGFINNKILINATYVRNRSSNQLLSYNLPIITGFTGIYNNFPALIQNKSLEFSLYTQNIVTKSIKWNSNINLTFPSNKLLEFPDLINSSYNNQLAIGRSLEEGYNFKTYQFYGVDPTTGIYQVYDQHGKPTTTPSYPSDATVFITSKPKLYGGIQQNIEYKGVQLEVFLQFTIQKYFNYLGGATQSLPGHFRRGEGNQPTSLLSRWQKPGDITTIQRFSANDLFYAYSPGDQAYQDVSFLRLKNLSISYDLSEKLVRSLKLNSCRLSLSAQNLITFTKYKGLDPESFNISTLPPLRIVTANLKLGL
jgi:TonB-linked SusC/RagA family outer membrane protein